MIKPNESFEIDYEILRLLLQWYLTPQQKKELLQKNLIDMELKNKLELQIKKKKADEMIIEGTIY